MPSRHDEDIAVNIERIDTAVVVRPEGEIDLSRSPAFRHRLIDVQSREQMDRLIVDLQDVPYMDSSGVATLVEAMQTSLRQQTELVLCGLQDRVQSIFEIAKLDSVFNIVPSVDEALHA